MADPVVTVERYAYSPRMGTFGVLTVGPFTCFTVERPWKDNQPQLSCVPLGTYPLVYEYSEKFKRELWELKNVPNRSECKIHVANIAQQLEGCIAPGDAEGWSAVVGHPPAWSVLNSSATLQRFHEAMGSAKAGTIVIRNSDLLGIVGPP